MLEYKDIKGKKKKEEKKTEKKAKECEARKREQTAWSVHLLMNETTCLVMNKTEKVG